MVHVIAMIQAQEGSVEKLIEAFRAILPAVRMKKGCLEYSLARHTNSGLEGQLETDPDMLMIIEKWTDLEALKAHMTDPAYQDWYRTVWPLVAGAGMQILASAE
jgi:quinol monooxygenase YgiN